MKYYYKTPEQVQKEIQEYIKQHKVFPYNKTFFILLLNIIILASVILVLDKTGILHRTFHHKSIQSINYKIEGNVIRFKFDVYRPVILSSSKMKEEYILHLQKIIIKTKEPNIVEFSPIITETIIDQENSFLDVELPKKISSEQIQSIYLILNDHKLEAKHY